MADINVERSGPSIWPWIIGLLVVALLIWFLVELFDSGEETAVAPEAATEVQPNTGIEPEPLAPPVPAAGLTVAQIVRSPATWTGQTFEGEVQVTEVPTDRGFWIEDQGERLFVILNDAPVEQPVAIDPGDRLRLQEAEIRDDPTAVPGDLDPDTRSIIGQQSVFLTVDEENVVQLDAAGAAGSTTM